jgi:hypothetical protein
MNVVTKEVKEEGERTDGMKNKDGERVSWRSLYKRRSVAKRVQEQTLFSMTV